MRDVNQPTDLRTERLVLHPVDRAEAQRIRDRRPDPQDDWAADYPFEGDIDALSALLRATEDGRDPRPFGYYQIQVGGRAVGGIGFFGPPAEGVVEIGYSLAPSARGHGYAGEAVVALLAAAGLGVATVHARTATDNAASRQTLRRAGFVEDGTDGELLRYSVELTPLVGAD